MWSSGLQALHEALPKRQLENIMIFIVVAYHAVLTDSGISLFKQISMNLFSIKIASLIPNLITRTIPFPRSELI